MTVDSFSANIKSCQNNNTRISIFHLILICQSLTYLSLEICNKLKNNSQSVNTDIVISGVLFETLPLFCNHSEGIFFLSLHPGNKEVK